VSAALWERRDADALLRTADVSSVIRVIEVRVEARGVASGVTIESREFLQPREITVGTSVAKVAFRLAR